MLSLYRIHWSEIEPMLINVDDAAREFNQSLARSKEEGKERQKRI